MQIVRDLAGYSLGRSDLVRRAMSKKKHDVMEEERKNFIYGLTDESGEVLVPGCVRRGIKEEVANTIFNQMMDFASYAFNKAHAAAYAVIGYQTAYLMRYHPAEFTAAMLNSFLGNADKCFSYLRFAKTLGIEVASPSINDSQWKYRVKEGKILFGLGAIKGVGKQMVETLVTKRKEEGPYRNLMDFLERNSGAGTLNKRAVEALIRSGVFDGLDGNRAQMLAVYERIMDGFSQKNKKNIEGQVSLFADLQEEEDIMKVDYPKLQEFSHKDLLFMEKDMTGMYLSGHPLDDYSERLRKAVSHKVSDILSEDHSILDDVRDDAALFADAMMKERALQDGDRVILGGLLRGITRKITRNSAMMAFLQLEDLSGVIEGIVFPKTYEKIVEGLKEDRIVLLKGRVSIKEEEDPKLIVESIHDLEEKTSKLYLRFPNMDTARKAVQALRTVFKTFSGEMPIIVVAQDTREVMQLSRDLWVDEDSPIVSMLQEKFGEENVKRVES